MLVVVRQVATEVVLIAVIVGAIVLVVHEVRTPSLRISVNAVPDDLKRDGFTEAAATELIRSELEAIQAVAISTAGGATLWREDQALQLSIPGTGLGLSDLTHQIKRLLGRGDQTITIYISRSKGQLGYSLRSNQPLLPDDRQWQAGANEAEVTRRAAEQIARLTQPFVLASYYYYHHQLNECRDTIKRMKRAYPPNSDMWVRAYNLSGMILADAGDHAGAIVEFTKANEQDPSSYVYANIAASWSATGDLTKAAKAYRDALEVDPDHATVWTGLSEILKRQAEQATDEPRREELQKQSDQAFTRALEIETDDPFTLHDLGLALGSRNRWEESVTVNLKAMELDDRTAEIPNGLGIALMNARRLDEAVQAFERAIELDPNLAFAWVNLCIVKKKLTKMDEAEAACRKALTLAPENETVRTQILNFGVAEVVEPW